MDRHFVKLTAASLSRLTVLVEQVAAVLDQRGSLRVRKAILSEARMAVDALRALDNGLIGFGFDDRPPTDLLDAESGRLRDLHAGRERPRPRPALRIVGGTDMEGANGNAA
jgi:hypothetical protein